MKFRYLSVWMTAGIAAFSLSAQERSADKTIALVYEDGKTPQALFHTALGHFSKLTQTGELKYAKLGTVKHFGEVIEVQTDSDSGSVAKAKRCSALEKVTEEMQKSNLPYSGRFKDFSTNFFFGDTSLGYVINPYRGCYDQEYLLNGLEKRGYRMVTAQENPDITLTIGIDVCMTENEYKAYIHNNTAPGLNTQTASYNGTAVARVNDGMSAQSGIPSGIKAPGAASALKMSNRILSKTAQERDVLRYHVTFSGKEKKEVEFYPFAFTDTTHKEGEPVNMGAYHELENIVFSAFLDWDAEDKAFNDKIPSVLKEKDFLKMTEQALHSKP